jgi:hypothetical protein
MPDAVKPPEALPYLPLLTLRGVSRSIQFVTVLRFGIGLGTGTSSADAIHPTPVVLSGIRRDQLPDLRLQIFQAAADSTQENVEAEQFAPFELRRVTGFERD